jgi:hypothetical protein
MNPKITHLISTSLFLFIQLTLLGQVRVTFGYAESEELLDYFQLEGIEYIKLSFTSSELANKTYQMSVKEIWDGEIKREGDIINSRMMPFLPKTNVGDTVLNIRIISKLTADNKLRMDFHFPTHSTQRYFEATSSNIYSLRSVMDVRVKEFEEKFYVLAYMLPAQQGNIQYYCAVANSGKEVETWGKEFGIKHYLVFEMKFESL